MQMNRRQALTSMALAAISGKSLYAETQSGSEQVERTDVAAKNVAVVRHCQDAFNRGDIEAATGFYAEDTRNHGVPVGRKGVLRVLTDIHATFPDWHTEEEEVAAIGEDVIVRAIVTGTHKGVGKIPVNGGLLVGVQPTGNQFKVQHIHWFTLKDGLIVEHRANRDDVGMMQQLGLLPAVKRYDLPTK
jgi:predicted ester cyclase